MKTDSIYKQQEESKVIIPEKSRVVWESHIGSQRLFLTCPYREVLYDGTRGNGKTITTLMDFAQHCGKGYGINWKGILCRRTTTSLTQIVSEANKFFPQIFPGARFDGSKNVWRWPEGEMLRFVHIRDINDYWGKEGAGFHGHEYPWIGWEELTLWPNDECYEMMKSCNRSSHPGMPRRYVSNTNSYGVGHNWIKAWFVDPALVGTPIRDRKGWTRCRIQGFLFENTHLIENDPEYVDTIRNTKDPNLRKAWWEGSWDIVAGGALADVYSERIHLVKPFAIPRQWSVNRSFDWGSSKPFSVGWWAKSDGSEVELALTSGKRVRKFFPKGTLFRIHEWYGWDGTPNKGCKMLSRDIAKGIKEIEGRWDFKVEAGPAGADIFSGEDGLSISDKMADEGVEFYSADVRPGSRIAGLERMRQLFMNAQQDPMEDPGLFIFDTCAHWRRCVPVIPRDEKKMDDADTNAEDHNYDDTRYEVMDLVYEEGEVQLSGI